MVAGASLLALAVAVLVPWQVAQVEQRAEAQLRYNARPADVAAEVYAEFGPKDNSAAATDELCFGCGEPYVTVESIARP